MNFFYPLYSQNDNFKNNIRTKQNETKKEIEKKHKKETSFNDSPQRGFFHFYFFFLFCSSLVFFSPLQLRFN